MNEHASNSNRYHTQHVVCGTIWRVPMKIAEQSWSMHEQAFATCFPWSVWKWTSYFKSFKKLSSDRHTYIHTYTITIIYYAASQTMALYCCVSWRTRRRRTENRRWCISLLTASRKGFQTRWTLPLSLFTLRRQLEVSGFAQPVSLVMPHDTV